MRAYFALTIAALLAACSASDKGSSSGKGQGAAESSVDAMVPADAAADPAKPRTVEVTLPQLAYSWSLGFILPTDKLASAQDAHRNLCESMGPARCQILALERDSGNDRTGDALLKLRVASNEAHAFQDKLAQAVTDAGGRATDTKVATEEVSKSIVDTEARIQQRELLVARLTEVLRTRKGNVSELIAAERSVTEAQEELDQARGWLKELQGRVAMSDFEIHYSAIAPAANAGSVGAQLSDATEGSAAAFLIGLRTFFTLAIYLLPWGLLVFPVIMLSRWLRRKRSDTLPQA